MRAVKGQGSCKRREKKMNLEREEPNHTGPWKQSCLLELPGEL